MKFAVLYRVVGLFAVLVPWSQRGLAAVYKVGADAACTHTTIAAAIVAANASTTTDRILIARNQSYDDQALVVDPPAAATSGLYFEGGYADCAQTVPDTQYTEIRGGGTGAVLTVLRPIAVVVQRLDLSGANNSGGARGDGAGLGGGIHFAGGNSLTVQHSRIAGNSALHGGGIHIGSAADGLSALYLMDADISTNGAALDGGGIHCDGAMIFTDPPRARVVANAAGRDGGGWFLRNCDARLVAGAAAVDGIATGNSALARGGGVFVDGGEVTIYSADAQIPARIVRNRAERGGGLALVRGEVKAWQLTFAENQAAAGAGAWISAGAASTGAAQLYLDGDMTFAPNAARACAGSVPCTGFIDNLARNADGEDGTGAALEIVGGPLDDRAAALISHAVFRGNDGINLVRTATAMEGSLLALHTTQISGNRSSAHLLSIGGTAFQAASVTLAGNTLRAGASFYVDAAALPRFTLRNSIVWQPAHPVITPAATGASTSAIDNLLVNSATGLPTSPDIVAAAPQFVAAASGDYRLDAGSPALDFVATVNLNLPDLQGRPRPVDLAAVANRHGAYDLGALERQRCGAVDTLFCDGLEP